MREISLGLGAVWWRGGGYTVGRIQTGALVGNHGNPVWEGGGVVTLRGSKEGLLLFILKCTYIKYLPLGSPPPDLPLNTAK